MEFKKYFIRYDSIWSRIRFVERKIDSYKADLMYYMSSNRIDNAEYKKKKQYYINKKQQLCTQIKNYRINDSNDGLNRGKRYIDSKELVMISNNGDQMGKVFLYKEEIYRGVYTEAAEQFHSIWNKGIIQVLGKQRLIPEVQISEYYTDEFPLILQIKRVHIQKNTMWSYAMVKDACILVSFLNDLLHEFGLTLLDGHLNNITFDKGRPVFIDIGSIIPYRTTAVQEELVFGGIFRLLFGYLGNCMLYRLPSHDSDNNNIFIKPRFFNQLTREYRFCLKEFKRYHWRHGNHRGRKIVHKIFDLYTVMPWDIDVLFPIKSGNIGITLELQKLNDFRGESIVDIGGGAGIIELILKNSNPFKEIKFIDFNENRLNETYNRFKSVELNSVFALYNYIYAQKGTVLDSLTADIVLCVDPFADNASFHGSNINTTAYALNRLGKKKAIIVFSSKEDIDQIEKKRFKDSLNKYYLMKEYSSDDSTFTYWIGKRK